MEKLKELVGVVSPNKIKTITLIGNGRRGDTKLHKLYELVADQKVSNDEEAFQRLYPNSRSKGSYYKLKHELRERLFNTLFFIDAKKVKSSDRQSAYLRCQWLLSASAILVLMRAWSNAMVVTKSALDIAEKYEFTNEAISASRRLMLANKLRGTDKTVSNYSLKLLSAVSLQQKETLAEIYWTQLSLSYVKESSYKAQVVSKAESYCYLLNKIESSQTSLKLIYLETMISACAKMANHDFDLAAVILEEGLETVTSYDRFRDVNSTYGIAVNLLACYIALKHHNQARKVLEVLYANVVVGTYNWYKTRELHFTLLMHTKLYDEAEVLFEDVVSQKTYAKQPAFVREAWTVYGAYLHILRQGNRLTGQPEAAPRAFRIQRYLNELPTFARDKRGHNVTVIISQIVLLLQQQNYDGLIDRFEAVNKYRERYVSREVNFRSNVFLHMFREVSRKNFVKADVLAATAELRLLLDEEPVDVISPGYDQEVLPYEDVWELLLECLE